MKATDQTIVGKVVLEYLAKLPSTPTRALARLLVEHEPLLFHSFNQARASVQYYRGEQGERQRMKMNKQNYLPRVVVPKSDIGKKEQYKPFCLSKFPIAIASDMHMPYHDKEAVEAFLLHAEKIGAKTILFNGDCMDAYQVSQWVRDPRKRSFVSEVEQMKAFLASVRQAFPDADIVYKEGNHEERYRKYLMQNAPALYGLEAAELPALLGCKEQNITYVSNKHVIIIKKLHILHGHEYTFSISSPVNPARGLYMRAKKSTICGHFHQTSEHSETSIDGKLVTCWSVGCLCDLHPEYMPLNKWNHGFADIIESNGSWNVNNYRMYQGKVL